MMSFSKVYYLDREAPFEDEKCLRAQLEDDFKKNVNPKAFDEFYNGFTSLERRILKRLISTKEPAQKISRRFKFSSEKLMALLFKASSESERLRSEELKRPELLSLKRPRFGCGHPIKENLKVDCPECLAVELSDVRKQDKAYPVVQNLHTGSSDEV